MAKIEVSGIRRMFDLAATLRDPIDLSLGQPDFQPPLALREALRRCVENGYHRYTPTQGAAELRDRLIDWWERQHGPAPAGSRAVVTVGATGALFLACAVLLDEGDEVLLPDPYFVLYTQIANFCGATPVLIDTYPTSFRLTPELIERRITPRTRCLIFNNPVNPTGIAYRPDEVRAIAATAKKHDLLVISDEVYDSFCYDFPHESLLRHHENTVLVGAFSKTFGIPGWRLGYAIGPAEIIEKMIVLQQFSYVCAPAPLQRAVAAVLDLNPSEWIVDSYRRKRDLVWKMLGERFELVKPQGAFYAFPRAPGNDADAFLARALQHNLLLVPGKTGSARNTHFRISYAQPDHKLARALELLCNLAR